MKTGLFLAAIVPLAAAQPHNNRHAHLHEKRENVVVTQVQTVTATAHNAVIFVNQQGQPISTSYCTESGPQATPVSYTSVVTAPAAQPTPHHHHHHNKPAPAPAAPAHGGHSHHNNGGHVSGNSGSGLSNLNDHIGIVYSPYNSDNSCKTQDEVNSDIQKIDDYATVRLYGVDCDQVSTVSNACKGKNMNLFLGVYDLSDVSGDLNTMHQGLGGDWSNVNAVSIGNELVNGGVASPESVVAAINSGRGTLRGLGYDGPVVTVDTFNAIIDNPSLCEASDFAAANAHPFFDPTCSAANAGSWAKGTAGKIKAACNKDVILTESGWPHAGSANGAAVPSPENQSAAISSLKQSFASGGLILFTAFDDLWKPTDAATFDAEKYWGILSGQ